jgi:enhancing lycopene biosynthesis protein 2
MDGSEVHESTLSLLYLAQGGAEWHAFAPDEPQVQVVNHVTQDLVPGEARNQMVEAGRIARGAIRPITELHAADHDGLLIPGGSGGFINLSRGPGEVHPELRRVILEFADASKPIAAICIAPVLVARVLGSRGVRLTIGTDAATAMKIARAGARHVECGVRHCVADLEHRVVSAPAYMLGPGIADVAAGLVAAVKTLLEWCP